MTHAQGAGEGSRRQLTSARLIIANVGHSCKRGHFEQSSLQTNFQQTP